MKRFLISLLCLWGVYYGYAQDISIPEPDFAYSAIYVKSTSEGIPLESVTPNTESNVKGLGYGGVESLWVVNGVKSNVRMPKEENISLKFIVRMPEHLQEVNPTQVIAVVKLDKNTKKSKRSMKMYSIDGLGREKDENETFAVSAKRYGEKSFLIELTEPLKTGEYAILMQQAVGGGTQGFGGWACFGVEGDGTDEEEEEESSSVPKSKKKESGTSSSSEIGVVKGFLVSLGYGDDGGVSLTAGYDHPVTEAITISPSLTYFIGYDGTFFSVNGDGKYFWALEELLIYGLAGLSYSSYSYEIESVFGTNEFSGSEIGFNFGSGLEYPLSDKMRLNALVKYNTAWLGQIELQAGLKFLF